MEATGGQREGNRAEGQRLSMSSQAVCVRLTYRGKKKKK